jgi:hypothetical protein
VFGIEEYEEFAMPRGNPNPRLNASAVSYKLQRYRTISDAAKVALFNDALLSYSAALDSADNSIFSSQPLLSEDSRNEIIGRSSAINDYIAREYLAREDGVLFLDPLPSPRGQGTSQSLTADESKQITQYVVDFKPELGELIYKKNVQGSSSIDLSRKAAARLLKIRATPIVIDGVVRRSPVSYFRWGRRSEKSQPRQKQKMLMSLHLPAVTVDGYLAEVDEHCIESIVEDYMDKPMGASSALRKATALRGCFRYARQAYVSERGICVHGNFMQLKYRFFESRLGKRYVTWIKDAVERLWAHYVLWRIDLDSDNELRRRMLDEDWSFERFANCPTITNI